MFAEKFHFPKSPIKPIKDSLEFKVITTFSVDGRAKWRNIYEFLYLPGLVCCNLVSSNSNFNSSSMVEGTRRLFLPYFSCALNNTNGRRFLFDKYYAKCRNTSCAVCGLAKA